MTDLQLANRSLVMKQYDQALELYLRHAVICPQDAAAAYVGAAECCLRSNVIQQPMSVLPGIELVSQGDLSGAERYFRLALQSNPNHPGALWGLAERLPNGSDERRDLLERAVATQPGTLNLVALGDYYRTRLRDYERAYELYKRAQEHNARDQTAYLRLGDICRRLGRQDEANNWKARWKEESK